jgi:hypothetical protein
MGRLSSGTAAQLAGVPRSIFLTRLADYGVDTFRLGAMGLGKETRLAAWHNSLSGSSLRII